MKFGILNEVGLFVSVCSILHSTCIYGRKIRMNFLEEKEKGRKGSGGFGSDLSLGTGASERSTNWLFPPYDNVKI